jgi:hypothetical protein
MTRKARILFPLIILLLVLPAVSASCSAGSSEYEYPMAPLNQMPLEIQHAPASVRQAYQFAVANPESTSGLPCYCGCGPIGHTANYACYVSDVKESGEVIYDGHALGCSICIDITLDAMRLLYQGKTLQEVRLYVDDTYSVFGPTNMP